MTLWIGIHGVGVRLCWTVPGSNDCIVVQWERVVFVVDVVVVRIVGNICTANGKVSEIVRSACTSHVGVKPIVNSVVVLVKRSAKVIVKVAVVVNFTINYVVTIAVSSRNLEDGRGDGCDINPRSRVSTRNNDVVSCGEPSSTVTNGN